MPVLRRNRPTSGGEVKVQGSRLRTIVVLVKVRADIGRNKTKYGLFSTEEHSREILESWEEL